MPAIVTNKFRIHNAEQFKESFSEASPNVYYMMLGRPQAYATSTRGDSRTENEGSDAAPITPADDVVTEFYQELQTHKPLIVGQQIYMTQRFMLYLVLIMFISV